MKKISKEFKGKVIYPMGYYGSLVIGKNVNYINEDDIMIKVSSSSKNEKDILKYLGTNKHVLSWILRSFDKLYGIKYKTKKTRDLGISLHPNKIIKNAHIKVTIERLD